MVCLMASTSGSCTASRRNCTTGSKLSKGWCSSTSPSSRSRVKMLCPRGSRPSGQRGSTAAKRRWSALAWSISWFSRTRLTGPFTRYSATSGRPNCSSRKRCRSSGQVLTTSRRMAWPKWRSVSPERSAWRRLVTSSSSTSRSLSRVTRNCEKATTRRPGNNACRWARMTLVSSTKPWRPSQMSSGRRMTRGSARGTLTMAMEFSRPKASRPSRRAMKFRLLLATSGNGWLGSRLSGTSSGCTCDSKNLATHSR